MLEQCKKRTQTHIKARRQFPNNIQQEEDKTKKNDGMFKLEIFAAKTLA